MTTAILTILVLLMAALVAAGTRPPRPTEEDRLPFSLKPPAVGFRIHIRNKGSHIHAPYLERGVPELCFVCELSFEGNVLGNIAPESPEWPGFVARNPGLARSISTRVAEALGPHLTNVSGWVIEPEAVLGHAVVKLPPQPDDDQG
jgi:hypothetical protein